MYGDQDEWQESRVHDQWGCWALFTAQMFRLVCGQRLEEEKVQWGYINRGSISRLTHLPKLLRVCMFFSWLRVAENSCRLTGKTLIHLLKMGLFDHFWWKYLCEKQMSARDEGTICSHLKGFNMKPETTEAGVWERHETTKMWEDGRDSSPLLLRGRKEVR